MMSFAVMELGKRTPLGDPAPDASKWFAAVEIMGLAADQDWLHKAAKEISKYWRNKRDRRMNSFPAYSLATISAVSIQIYRQHSCGYS